MKKMLSNPKQFERYHRWPTWLLVLLGCGMIEGFFFLGTLIFGIIVGIIFWGFLHVFGQLQNAELSKLVYSLHVELLAFASVAMLLLAWVKWVEKRSIVTLGFYKEKWFKELLLGFGLGTIQFSLSLLLVCLLGGSYFQTVDFSATTLLFVISIIPFWLIQGGTEELLTRGWLLPLINSRLGISVAVGLSSLLFGLIHLGNDHVTFLSILDLVLSGITTALYMLYRDNLWSVVGLHGAWNFVQGNIYGIEVSGKKTGPSIFHFVNNPNAPDWLSGGYFGTEGSLITCLVEVCFMLGILYLIKRQQRQTGSV